MATKKKEQKTTKHNSLQVGDQVRWNRSGGKSEGKIIKIATRKGQIKDFAYTATEKDPRFIVETKDGKQAAHKAEELHKV